MQSRTDAGGFEFMPRPSNKYYRELPDKVGGSLTAEQYRMVEEMGILVDKDDKGVLLQIFTRPLGEGMDVLTVPGTVPMEAHGLTMPMEAHPALMNVLCLPRTATLSLWMCIYPASY